jgi:hypothetical protein
MNLSREAFATAIRRGHGRAALYVQTFGLSAVEDIVLESCLKNPAYDLQCEPSRAAWLFGMFKNSAEYPRFESAILSALHDGNNDSRIEHLCDMTAQMAIAGSVAATEALRDRVLSQSFAADTYQFGCDALVRVDGIDAVIELARRYGNVLLEDAEGEPSTSPDFGYWTGLHPLAESTFDWLAESDDAIRAFWSSEQTKELQKRADDARPTEEVRRDYRERMRSKYPLEKALHDARVGVGEYPSQYAHFGKYATEEELKTVLSELIEQTDEETHLRLLWVFRRVPLPELHPMIWELAASTNDEVRSAAINALAQSTDSRVGNLGRNLLSKSASASCVVAALHTFEKNYLPGDATLIMSALTRISPNDDEAHEIGFSIARICRERGPDGLSQLLRWDYERNPCTLCRGGTVERLNEIGALDTDLISECLFDADEEIRKLAEDLVSHRDAQSL